MEKIGIFYSFGSKKTSHQAKKIVKHLGKQQVQEVDLNQADHQTFEKFRCYILGVPTWFDGELPNYWDEFLPTIEGDNLEGKLFALFGGGDQKRYPENFVDGLGLLAEFIEQRGGSLVGFTSIEGYSFEYSLARRNDQFVGLALDIENQAALTDQRIESWVKEIKKAFEK